MDGFNRILGIVVGLFVVLLVIGFVLGRFNKDKSKSTSSSTSSGLIGSIFNKKTPTPTVKKPETVTINTTSTNVATTRVVDRQSMRATGTIPDTGAELIFPLATSLVVAGAYLRKLV